MNILGIESSCDETGVALVRSAASGTPKLLAHALHSQIDMHQAYGGVVPELAVECVRQQRRRAARGGTHQRHAGFVARRFDAENVHATKFSAAWRGTPCTSRPRCARTGVSVQTRHRGRKS